MYVLKHLFFVWPAQLPIPIQETSLRQASYNNSAVGIAAVRSLVWTVSFEARVVRNKCVILDIAVVVDEREDLMMHVVSVSVSSTPQTKYSYVSPVRARQLRSRSSWEVQGPRSWRELQAYYYGIWSKMGRLVAYFHHYFASWEGGQIGNSFSPPHLDYIIM